MENFEEIIWIRPDAEGDHLFRMELSGDHPEAGLVFFLAADDINRAASGLRWYLRRKFPEALRDGDRFDGVRCDVEVVVMDIPEFSWSVSFDTVPTDSDCGIEADSGFICENASGPLPALAYEAAVRGFLPDMDPDTRLWRTECVVDPGTGEHTVYGLRVHGLFDLGLLPVVSSIMSGVPAPLPERIDQEGFGSWGRAVLASMPFDAAGSLGDGEISSPWFRRFYDKGYPPVVAAREFVEKSDITGVVRWDRVGG